MRFVILGSEIFYGTNNKSYPNYWFDLGYIHKICKGTKLAKIYLASIDPEGDAESFQYNKSHELHYLEKLGIRVGFVHYGDLRSEDVLFIVHFFPPIKSSNKSLGSNYGITFDEFQRTMSDLLDQVDRIVIEDSDSEIRMVAGNAKMSGRYSYVKDICENYKHKAHVITTTVHDKSLYDGMDVPCSYIPTNLTQELIDMLEVPFKPLRDRTSLIYLIGGLSGRKHVVDFFNALPDISRPKLAHVAWYDFKKLNDAFTVIGLTRVERRKFIDQISQSVCYLQGASWYKTKPVSHPLDCTPLRYTSKIVECALSKTLLVSLRFPESRVMNLPNEFIIRNTNSEDHIEDIPRVVQNVMDLLHNPDDYAQYVQKQSESILNFINADSTLNNNFNKIIKFFL